MIILILEFSSGSSNLLVLQLFDLNRYLSEQKLPSKMLELQKGCTADYCNNVTGEDGECTDSGEDSLSDKETSTALENIEFPFEVGDLRIISLGNFSRLLDTFL